MDSRQIVQQQNREAAAVPGGVKKQKNMEAERKNRRALGDIGNKVTIPDIDGKPIPQICRPVTRSFCAQLLANAQAAAAENNKKNSIAVNANGSIVVDGAMPKPVVKKPAQKKAITKPKPKPEEVIDISSDTEEVKKEKPVNESRAHDYMDSQPEINEKMRAILVDWLIQVHHKFELSPETLYLTINIVDRYLAVKTTSRRELQLLGISSMLIASKYEEIWAPEVNDLVCISDRAYTNEQVLRMEKRILGELEWNLTVPTPYMFLVRFIKASLPDSCASIFRLGYEPYKVENMVYFLAELGMMNYAIVMHCPSMIAASAVYAARCTLNKVPVWTETLKIHTGYSEPQLMECAKLLVSFHSMAADHKLKVIYKKYSSPERGAVALLPPAKSLLAAS
ncbi:unnamed protein product [Fraxinus pennsylvanica]|uniref:Cyclin N-terminal domain-containing protein n=1 Tax=Fraxinus pennsylvanica TaxID=56036 RepID=A0AAD2A1J3_9LAMI|nr:unnamed protein product [Fraxinus pennsylvanica]